MRWPYTEKENEKEAKFRHCSFASKTLSADATAVGVQITFPERRNNSSQLIITLIRHGLKSKGKKKPQNLHSVRQRCFQDNERVRLNTLRAGIGRRKW
jgi:hypothetical protein